MDAEGNIALAKDLAHLREVKLSALSTGKRQFRCMKCGGTMVLKRIARGCDVTPEKLEE